MRRLIELVKVLRKHKRVLKAGTAFAASVVALGVLWVTSPLHFLFALYVVTGLLFLAVLHGLDKTFAFLPFALMVFLITGLTGLSALLLTGSYGLHRYDLQLQIVAGSIAAVTAYLSVYWLVPRGKFEVIEGYGEQFLDEVRRVFERPPDERKVLEAKKALKAGASPL
ncbi:hypothetical protein [Thermofilum pendens]|uniref:Uncharacterized protein n=1 Tax=Thermofilum pendens (strain DSM 2475 / Hrk 5) TaxID=368408 RepID=A1S1C4_THEPD|nr:hypothetical protein [Thermofilum pendens]ABL79254.1 hypothetical protein Tpen_1859 [Thermofilum pendens Hrk 5]